MWDEIKDVFTGPIGPWVCLFGLVVISLAVAGGRATVIHPDHLCLGCASRRETLRIYCVGPIHVDPGGLFRCVLRDAAPDDFETLVGRRSQKGSVMLQGFGRSALWRSVSAAGQAWVQVQD